VTRGWLAIAVLSVLILPQVLQRADSGHFAFIAPVSLGLLPWAVIRGTRLRLTTAAIPLLSVIVIGFGAALGYSNKGVAVHNDGRTFAAASAEDAVHLQRVLDWIDTRVAPGRRLLVGPADLRWAFYAPTELYFLTPGLQPAGFYLELGPGDDTPLFARQFIEGLNRADVLVPDRPPVSDWRRQIWPEARAGSEAPNAVVRRDFRPAFRAGPYSIWLRAGRGNQPSARIAPA
jgi:hypothetical protein